MSLRCTTEQRASGMLVNRMEDGPLGGGPGLGGVPVPDNAKGTAFLPLVGTA